MSSEVVVAVIAGLLAALPSLVGTIWAVRRFSLADRRGVVAQADSDDATAQKSFAEAGGFWLESYEKIFRLLQSRDMDVFELRSRMGKLELDHATELAAEVGRRVQVEKQRDQLRLEVQELKGQLSDLNTRFDRLTSPQISTGATAT